ncbi:MAG: ech hydrogenase subunit, partial [Campylobacterota bacterium]|nr:ech hydrogenase subunit [Campylobacterota bacterium]
FSHAAELTVVILDFLLLGYFFWQGFLHKNKLVFILALLGITLLAAAEWNVPNEDSFSLIIDEFSKLMFLIINIVGGVIVLYALKYIEYENISSFRKKLFIAYLLVFLSIMNLIVSANNILLFFFLFELTALASYLLIGFRKDEISTKNSLLALWMNQLGGVAILIGALLSEFFFKTISFDLLLLQKNEFALIVVSFLVMAAFIKGAMLPFDKWLLGAMVAPTPVSAMLHSATMVKIAPFMILKLSPLLAGSLLGLTTAIFSGFVFLAASYFALSRDIFKEILGYSTIAMLALMILMASIGTTESLYIAMILMVFHAISKALLFLTAGVLEKNLQIKKISQMGGLINAARLSVFFIVIGFISLVLPPFGAFMGKVFAIESVTKELGLNIWFILPLLALTIGSVVMTLLYFKITSSILSKNQEASSKEKIDFGFLIPLVLLLIFLFVTGFAFFKTDANFKIYLFALPLFFILLVLFFLYKIPLKYKTAREYHCAESERFEAGNFYFELDENIVKKIYLFFTLFFVGFIFFGVLS